MSALSQLKVGKRIMTAFGPSPRAMTIVVACLSLPAIILGVAYKAYPLIADYFNRDVCDVPADKQSDPFRDSYRYDYAGPQGSDCVSPDEHRDQLFGIPTSIAVGIFAALLVVGLIYLVALVHEYSKTVGTVQSFSRKRVVGYDLMEQITTTLLMGLALVGAYFALFGIVSMFEAFIAMNNDMTAGISSDHA